MSVPEQARVVLDDPGEPAPPTTGPPTAAPSSSIRTGLVGVIRQGADAQLDDDEKTMRVGKHPTLWARYRVLLDEDRELLDEQIKTAIARREKHDGPLTDLEKETEAAALLLSMACVDVGIKDGTTYVPFHEALAASDDEGDRELATGKPLRFNAELAGIILPDMASENGRPPSAVTVVKRLHLWSGSHQPLRTRAQMLQVWMSAVATDAIKEAMEGN